MLRKERAQEGNSPCNSQVKQEGTRKDFVNQGDLYPFGELANSIEVVPPTGIEPVHLPPEGSALSPELRGRR